MFKQGDWVYAIPEQTSHLPEIQGRNGIVVLGNDDIDYLVDFGRDLRDYFKLSKDELKKGEIDEYLRLTTNATTPA